MHRAGEVARRLGPGVLAALRSDPPALDVVRRDMDPHEQARDARLVGGIPIGRPLQGDRLGRPFFVDELPGAEVVLVIGIELQPANTTAVASRLARNRVGKVVMAVSGKAVEWFCPRASWPGSESA